MQLAHGRRGKVGLYFRFDILCLAIIAVVDELLEVYLHRYEVEGVVFFFDFVAGKHFHHICA